MSPRVTMSTVADEAAAEMAEPVPKMTRPSARQRYRPKRSPRLPAVSRSPAKTIVYASTIHCSSLPAAFKPPEATGFASVGMATLRTVLSRPITMRLKHSTRSVYHRRR